MGQTELDERSKPLESATGSSPKGVYRISEYRAVVPWGAIRALQNTTPWKCSAGAWHTPELVNQILSTPLCTRPLL